MSDTSPSPQNPTPTPPADNTDEEVVSVKNGSHFFGLSLRGLIALAVVGTICYMALRAMKVEEPFSSIATLTIGFYFGQNSKK